MLIKHCLSLLTLPLLLAACVPAEETAGQMATDLKDNIYQTTAKVKEWTMTPPPGKQPPLPVKDSYCYRTLQDILCYRQPMPGWEGRLVAYQGTDAKAPPVAMMQLLPVHSINPDVLPAQRAANAKPVFKAPPVEAKDDAKTQDASGTTTAAETHEQLPDPALAPQL